MLRFLTIHLYILLLILLKMVKIKCRCGYEWETKSELSYVSCPSCLNKVKIEQGGKQNERNS